MNDEIRKILADHGRLAIDIGDLDDAADLYAAGLTSHSSVNVMLALEDAFDFEFPQEMLRKKTFESVESISEALSSLGVTSTPGPVAADASADRR